MQPNVTIVCLSSFRLFLLYADIMCEQSPKDWLCLPGPEIELHGTMSECGSERAGKCTHSHCVCYLRCCIVVQSLHERGFRLGISQLPDHTLKYSSLPKVYLLH